MRVIVTLVFIVSSLLAETPGLKLVPLHDKGNCGPLFNLDKGKITYLLDGGQEPKTFQIKDLGSIFVGKSISVPKVEVRQFGKPLEDGTVIVYVYLYLSTDDKKAASCFADTVGQDYR